MTEIKSTECCGIKEINGLHRKTKRLMLSVCYSFFECDDDAAYLFFSDIVPNRGGLMLAQFIKAHKLGTVHYTGQHENPNSGNQLGMWIWTVDRGGLRDWWYENKKSFDEDWENDSDDY